MTPIPNRQRGPENFPNPPKIPEVNENTNRAYVLDPAVLARWYEDIERFERLTAGLGANRRNGDLGLEDSIDTSTVYGMMLIIIVALTIYGFRHLMVETFKNFRFE